MDGCLAAALNGAEGIDALTSAAKDLLADEGWIARLIAGAADALRRDPFFAVPYRAARNDLRAGLLVLDRRGLSITLDIANQETVKAYGREGEPCYECGTPMRRIKVGGRSSVFCPTCQKPPRVRASKRGAKRAPAVKRRPTKRAKPRLHARPAV